MAEIDLGALRRNVDVLRSHVDGGDPSSDAFFAAAGDPPSRTGIMAVLKADAYGHGAVPCAQAVARQVWGFAVSLVEEGVELRRAGLIDQPIVVLGCFYGLSHRDVVAYRLTPVVADARDLSRFARAAADLGAPRVPVHLKIDTGMSRLGVRPESLDAFVDVLRAEPGVALGGLCTHLADADGPGDETTHEQLERFFACRQRLSAMGLQPGVLHAANTAGAVRFGSARLDLVRPGIGLYGVAPPNTALSGLWPVLSLKTRIVALREVPAHTGVSYGSRTRTQAAARIATLPIGYADGYSRRMSGQAQVLCGGRRCSVLGPITMDMTMIDVSAVPDVQIGDEVVLIGGQARRDCVADAPITLDEMAGWAGTIAYEICCAISKRVPRIYTGL
ncbi:MAG: alanine racemase [Myxococcales bacterium]|nr:alanine racemase [Myxococcales bacterium]